MVAEHAGPPTAPGGENTDGRVAELSRALAERGHEVVVYTRHTGEEEPDDLLTEYGVRVRPVRAGPAGESGGTGPHRHLPGFARGLRAAWERDTPDVVHAHLWRSGVAALDAARGADVPVVQTFYSLGTAERRHRGDTPGPPERTAAERSVALRASLVVAVSTEEQRELRSWGVAPDRVRVVPCGVDLAHFTPEGPSAPRGSTRRAVSVGGLAEHGGAETVVRALAAVPGTELLVAGGPEAARLRTDAETVRLHRVAREAGVADRVRFLSRVTREDVPVLLRSADVFVDVSRYEPVGTNAVQAMACGVPVVASDVGGHRDAVVHEVTGLLVPPRDPRVLAAQLRALLGDVVAAESYGIAGADRAAARFSWQAVARSTEECYAHALRLAGRPVPAPDRGPGARVLTAPGG